jgi:ribulose-5-phosphate 4-epimerase/fuculose-1-phosphate aldolase
VRRAGAYVEKLVRKYEKKLIHHQLVSPEGPLLGGMDVEMFWNREDPLVTPVLEEVAANLNINSILFARPAEPYYGMVNHLISRLPAGESTIRPRDNENRIFLHDLPVARDFTVGSITQALKRRKCVIVENRGVVTYGTVSPEQAFIVFSSVCFSVYVKFFVEHYQDIREGRRNDAFASLIHGAASEYEDVLKGSTDYPPLMSGPFDNQEDVIQAICEAGRLTVEKRMVDSFFGNISYRLAETIHCTQTTSTLDELEGYIDPCPIDNSTCAAITASSEYTAHKGVYLNTNCSAVLHGHPKFSVILSLMCDKEPTCELRDLCHTKCTTPRYVGDIPIIPGETGTGADSISETLPPALSGQRGAIIYGHGLFTTGKKDFTDAFANLLQIENACFHEYFARIEG